MPKRKSAPTRFALYGKHAVWAALANRSRKASRLLVSAKGYDIDKAHTLLQDICPWRLSSFGDALGSDGIATTICSDGELARAIGTPSIEEGAIQKTHQGWGLECLPLRPLGLEELEDCAIGTASPIVTHNPQGHPAHVAHEHPAHVAHEYPAHVARGHHDHEALSPQQQMPRIIVAVDGITDVRNLGAIARVALLQGADGILMCDHHSPKEYGSIVKAAVGAWDILPICRVTNLSRALNKLKTSGWWVHGLSLQGRSLMGRNPIGSQHDAATANTVTSSEASKIVIVIGAEDKGIRRLTADTCDQLWMLPMQPRYCPSTDKHPIGPESHNVAVALGMALALLQAV
ncbi:MAG: RNA methyltransferase [Alphaproteobacteria bacterium]|nr:RNA methyltransferase [Alphaproteobacteria bacterium]